MNIWLILLICCFIRDAISTGIKEYYERENVIFAISVGIGYGISVVVLWPVIVICGIRKVLKKNGETKDDKEKREDPKRPAYCRSEIGFKTKAELMAMEAKKQEP